MASLHVMKMCLVSGTRPAVHFAKLTLREVKTPFEHHRQSDNETIPSSIVGKDSEQQEGLNHNSAVASTAALIPVFDGPGSLTAGDVRVRFTEACTAWLTKSSSVETRTAYTRELGQFLDFVGIAHDELEQLVMVRPYQVAAWRDRLRERGLSNVAIVRKITVLRSLFSYLQTYGYAGANPAHQRFCHYPAGAEGRQDGRTLAGGLSPVDERAGHRDAGRHARSGTARGARVHGLPRRRTHATSRDGLQADGWTQGS